MELLGPIDNIREVFGPTVFKEWPSYFSQESVASFLVKSLPRKSPCVDSEIESCSLEQN